MKITIVGAGPGRLELWNDEAKNAVVQAEMVLTTRRFSQVVQTLNSNYQILLFSEIKEYIQNLSGKISSVAVLVSGDVGFYSAAKLFCSIENSTVTWVNGLNSLQYLCAKCNMDYQDFVTVSVHGREGSVVPYVCYHPKVFILTGGKQKAQDVLQELTDHGLGNVKVIVGENLSAENERICYGTALDLSDEPFEELAVLLIQNDLSIPPWNTLRDSDFIRGKVPMTKEAVRTLSLMKLNLRPDDIVYDIGAGTGAVSIAMARKVYHSFVYAIESNQTAFELAAVNIRKLQAYNVKLIAAEAPEGLEELPPPDKAFIGGSHGKMKELFSFLISKNPRLKLVVNAITLETLRDTCELMESYGLHYEVICAAVSESEHIGKYHMMKAQNPVYIIYGEANGTE